MARRTPAAVLAVLVLLLAGCGRLEGDLTINGTDSAAPDTVSGTMLVAVSDQWALAQGQDPDAIGAGIAEELSANPDSGLTGQPYDDGEYTGAELTLTDVPLERLVDASGGVLEVARDGDAYVVRGDLANLDPSGVEADAGPDAAPWTAAFSVTFPEPVGDHNGSLSGRTVSWDITGESDDTTVFATSSVGPVPWTERVPWWLVGLVVLAGVGAAVAFVLGRRQRARERSTGGGGFRERQAQARGGSSAKLDEILARGERVPGRPKGTRPGRGSRERR